MDMLRSARIAEAGLTDWRKLAQGLHARFRTDGFAAGARFAVCRTSSPRAVLSSWPRSGAGPSWLTAR